MTGERTYRTPAQDALRAAIAPREVPAPPVGPVELTRPVLDRLAGRVEEAVRYAGTSPVFLASIPTDDLRALAQLARAAATHGYPCTPDPTLLAGADGPRVEEFEEFEEPTTVEAFAATWNASTPEERERWWQVILDNADAAHRCLAMNHKAQADRAQHMTERVRELTIALDECSRRELAPLERLGEEAARLPGARTSDPSTSHTAHASVSGTPKARNHLGRLLLAYLRWGRVQAERHAAGFPDADQLDGLTSEQAANLAGLLRAEYAKRASELVDLGYLRVARDEHGHERTRQGAAGRPRLVFELTDAGRRLAEGIEVKAL